MRVTRRLMAEAEIKTLVHFAGVQPLLENALDKLACGQQREVASKGQQENGVDPCGFEQAELFGSGGEQFQSCFGPQDPGGMGLEGGGGGFPLACPRSRNDLPQHMGMSAMHSVEVTHRDDGGAEVRGNVVEFVEDLHASCGAGAPARVCVSSSQDPAAG